MAADNNSFTRNDKPVKPSFEERKKDMTQYIGVKQVTKKENEWWVWFKTMFFSGRTLKDILKDVAENQIVPQIKDNFRNSLVSMLDMGIYRDHNSTPGSMTTPGSFVTNYVSYAKQSAAASINENKKKDEEIIKSGYECPAFARKVDADNFIASMKEYVTKYTTMSVQDLAWMQGKRIDYTWDKYGWKAEQILAIQGPRHISNPEAPWIIDLPKAEVLE